MEDLPIRDRNHEIESLSERYFKSLVPVSWVVNPFHLDYGTDYNCEIVIDKKVTGMNFSVQLKGKETEINKENICIRIRRATINRWLKRLEPTILIVFIVDEGEAYWTIFENNTVNLTSPIESFAIKISRERKLSQINWDNLVEYVGTIFSKKHLLYTLPEIKDHNESAWRLYFEKKFEKALPIFYDLLDKNFTDTSILNAIATSHYFLFNYQKALIFINKALENERNEILYFNKAAILTEQGNLLNDTEKIKEAIEIYYRLIEADSVSYSLFYSLGTALCKLKDYEKSIFYFKKAIDLDPNNPEVWNNLGNSYMNLGQHHLEMQCYNSALLIDPDLPETLFSKGSSLFRYFQKTEQGLQLMVKAANLSNRYEIDNPYFFFWIAEAYLFQEDYENSKKWNSKGLNCFSTDSFLKSQKLRIENNGI